MKNLCGALVCSVMVALALASPAYAQGVTLMMRNTAAGQTTNQQVQMDRAHIRVESRNNNDSIVFVYDGPAKVMRMINLSKKSYVEINQAQVQQMSQQANAAMAAMQAQVKEMPPEQQKMMQELMKRRGGLPDAAPAAPARPVYKSAGSDKAGQWTCTKYEGYRGAEKVAEVCAVEPKELGLAVADFAAAQQLSAFLKSMMPTAIDQVSLNGTVEEQGFPGVAVRRVTFRNGKPEMTNELTEIRREPLAASVFAAPDGFRRENMPAIPGAR